MKSAWMILGVGLLLAADTAPDDVKKELAKFKGTWKFVSIEAEGQKTPEEVFKDTRLVLDGDKFTVTGGNETFAGTFKVDISKKPKKIDVIFTEGPEKGKTSLGIYELEGDTYKVCIGLAGNKDRPTEFASKPDSGHILEVLKRVKP